MRAAKGPPLGVVQLFSCLDRDDALRCRWSSPSGCGGRNSQKGWTRPGARCERATDMRLPLMGGDAAAIRWSDTGRPRPHRLCAPPVRQSCCTSMHRSAGARAYQHRIVCKRAAMAAERSECKRYGKRWSTQSAASRPRIETVRPDISVERCLH
jgi:hypothetical protein